MRRGRALTFSFLLANGRNPLSAWRSKLKLLAHIRSQHSECSFAVLPLQINSKGAASPHSLDRPRRPSLRKRRQKTDFTGVALQQQLGYARRATKVSVDLKRRMIVQQVWQSRFRQQRHDVFMRQITFFQSCPEVDNPRPTPSRVAASCLQPTFQRNPRCLRQLRRAAERDLISRMQCKEMLDVPVTGLSFLVVL